MKKEVKSQIGTKEMIKLYEAAKKAGEKGNTVSILTNFFGGTVVASIGITKGKTSDGKLYDEFYPIYISDDVFSEEDVKKIDTVLNYLNELCGENACGSAPDGNLV